jgi:hypothetical protein
VAPSAEVIDDAQRSKGIADRAAPTPPDDASPHALDASTADGTPAPAQASVAARAHTDGGGSYVVPGLMIGGGVLAIAGGVYLEESTKPPVGSVEPSYLHSAPGFGLIVGGALVTAIGGYVWYRWASSSHSAPTVQTTSRGVTVGWAAEF